MKLSETHASTLAIDVLQKAIESLSGGAIAIENAVLAVNADQEAALSE